MSQNDTAEIVSDEKQGPFPKLTAAIRSDIMVVKSQKISQRVLTSVVYLTFLISSINSRP
jgi:hypothetical protein